MFIFSRVLNSVSKRKSRTFLLSVICSCLLHQTPFKGTWLLECSMSISLRHFFSSALPGNEWEKEEQEMDLLQKERGCTYKFVCIHVKHMTMHDFPLTCVTVLPADAHSINPNSLFSVKKLLTPKKLIILAKFGWVFSYNTLGCINKRTVEIYMCMDTCMSKVCREYKYFLYIINRATWHETLTFWRSFLNKAAF